MPEKTTLKESGTPVCSDHESGQAQAALSRWRRVYLDLAFIYAVFLLYGSMIPFNIQPVPLEEALTEFIHLLQNYQFRWSPSDTVTNTLMFVPLMFCVFGTCANPSRRWDWMWKLPLIFVCGVAFSFLLEFSQVYIPGRTVSSHDLITQTIGNLMGIAAWLVLGVPLTLWLDGLVTEKNRLNQRTKILYLYIALLILYSIFPLNFTISPGQIWQKYKEGMINFIPFYGTGELDLLPMVMKLILYLPIGFMFTCKFPRPGLKSLIAGLCGGLFVASAIEGLQVLVASRYATATDVAMGVIGSAIGSVVCMFTGPIATGKGVHGTWWKWSGVWFKLLALILWIAVMVNDRWPMLELQRSWEEIYYRWEHAISRPLGQIIYSAGPLFALPRLVQEFVTSLILGMLLQALLVRFRFRNVYSVVIGIAMVTTHELGRLLYSQYVPDSTILLTAIFGVVASIWAYPRLIRSFLTPDNRALNQD